MDQPKRMNIARHSFSFYIVKERVIMEHNRESGNRGGHPGGNAPAGKDRQAAADGFEGMNYEQRREPYFTKRQQTRIHPDSDHFSGSSEYSIDGNPAI